MAWWSYRFPRLLDPWQSAQDPLTRPLAAAKAFSTPHRPWCPAKAAPFGVVSSGFLGMIFDGFMMVFWWFYGISSMVFDDFRCFLMICVSLVYEGLCFEVGQHQQGTCSSDLGPRSWQSHGPLSWCGQGPGECLWMPTTSYTVLYIHLYTYTAGGGGSPRWRQSGSLNWRKNSVSLW